MAQEDVMEHASKIYNDSGLNKVKISNDKFFYCVLFQ